MVVVEFVGIAADRGVSYFLDNHRKSLQMSFLSVFDSRFLECVEDPPALRAIRKHKRRV